MGTNVRKTFYVGKTRGPTKLDQEGDMDIWVITLGAYDVGEDPFYWSPNIRRQLNCVRRHISKLTERKGSPQSFKDSFVGLRADLRQGCLTVDLVIAGGRDPSIPRWLKGAFAEIAAQPVNVETIYPLDHKDVINEFGNLMSSAFIYSDVEECIAMLEALKGWRIVQPQGKFYQYSAHMEEKSEIVSIGKPEEDPIETISDPKGKSAGAQTRPPCPECGLPTHAGGFKTGRWEKLLGNWSNKLTWVLLEDDDAIGGGAEDGFEDFREDVERAREDWCAR
jgi:hypothetical protein